VKIHSAQQGSLEWLQARAGKVTASCLNQILTPEFKVRTGQMPQTYLFRTLAERWLGQPLPQPEGVWNLEQGSLLEEYGLPAFTLETGLDIKRVGLCETDDGQFACSPDGLIGDDAGLELKCPHIHTHISYLLEGEIPPQYRAQVHGCMAVTGTTKWYFCSFRRMMPPLVLTVNRDEKIQNAIMGAVAEFNERLAEGWETLLHLNGGKPPIRQTFTPTPGPVRFTWEQPTPQPTNIDEVAP